MGDQANDDYGSIPVTLSINIVVMVVFVVAFSVFRRYGARRVHPGIYALNGWRSHHLADEVSAGSDSGDSDEEAHPPASLPKPKKRQLPWRSRGKAGPGGYGGKGSAGSRGSGKGSSGSRGSKSSKASRGSSRGRSSKQAGSDMTSVKSGASQGSRSSRRGPPMMGHSPEAVAAVRTLPSDKNAEMRLLSGLTDVAYDHAEEAFADQDEAERLVSISYFDEKHRKEPLFAWMKQLYNATETDILNTAGLDALFYMRFSRIFFVVFTATMVLGLSVLLPLHLTGGGGLSGFRATTVANIGQDRQSRVFWAHLVFSYLFSGLIMYLIWRFFAFFTRIRTFHKTTATVRDYAIKIKGLPTYVTSEAALRRYFESRYPGRVLEARIAYDLGHFLTYEQRRKAMVAALEIAEAKLEATGVRPTTAAKWYTPWRRVDAIGSLVSDLGNLKEVVIREQDRALTGTGVAFVTFTSVAAARRAFDDHQIKFRGTPAYNQELADHLQPQRWKVRMAPHPQAVLWRNLKVSKRQNLLRVMLLNMALFVAMIFFSTPVAILSLIGELIGTPSIAKQVEELRLATGIESVLYGWVPSLMFFLITFQAAPAAVRALTNLQGYDDRSKRDRSIFRKNFAWFIANVIILPLFIQTSMLTLFRVFFQSRGSSFELIGEAFLATNSAVFFVNALIMYSFLGNSFELWRPFHWLAYRFSVYRSVTAEQRERIVLNFAEFDYGFQYAYLVAVNAMGFFFSLNIPVLSFFAWAHFAGKYYVDKYNLLFVHPTHHETDLRMSLTACNYVNGTTLFVYQLSVAGFFFLKSAGTQFFLEMMLFGVTLVFFLGLYTRSLRERDLPVLDNVQEVSDVMTFSGAYAHPGLYLFKAIQTKTSPSHFATIHQRDAFWQSIGTGLTAARRVKPGSLRAANVRRPDTT